MFCLGLTSAIAADWPRQVTDSRGVHTPGEQTHAHCLHQRDLTGSLLAIDAPVVASGATTLITAWRMRRAFTSVG